MSVSDTMLSHHSSVAVKRFTRPFENLQHARRTLREILSLKVGEGRGSPRPPPTTQHQPPLSQHLRGGAHNHVLQFLGLYSPQATTGGELHDLYMVTELCDSDLRTVLSHNQLTEAHIQLIMYRVACGMRYIHSAGIIHRDLKPENIAVFAGGCWWGRIVQSRRRLLTVLLQTRLRSQDPGSGPVSRGPQR